MKKFPVKLLAFLYFAKLIFSLQAFAFPEDKNSPFRPYRSPTEFNTSDTTLDTPGYYKDFCRTIYENADYDFFAGKNPKVKEIVLKECSKYNFSESNESKLVIRTRVSGVFAINNCLYSQGMISEENIENSIEKFLDKKDLKINDFLQDIRIREASYLVSKELIKNNVDCTNGRITQKYIANNMRNTLSKVKKLLKDEKEYKNWEFIREANNQLFIKKVNPKSNQRYREFYSRTFKPNSIKKSKGKVDCKEWRLNTPSSGGWVYIDRRKWYQYKFVMDFTCSNRQPTENLFE